MIRPSASRYLNSTQRGSIQLVTCYLATIEFEAAQRVEFQGGLLKPRRKSIECGWSGIANDIVRVRVVGNRVVGTFTELGRFWTRPFSTTMELRWSPPPVRLASCLARYCSRVSCLPVVNVRLGRYRTSGANFILKKTWKATDRVRRFSVIQAQ